MKYQISPTLENVAEFYNMTAEEYINKYSFFEVLFDYYF
jgi:hypothetical protein